MVEYWSARVRWPVRRGALSTPCSFGRRRWVSLWGRAPPKADGSYFPAFVSEVHEDLILKPGDLLSKVSGRTTSNFQQCVARAQVLAAAGDAPSAGAFEGATSSPPPPLTRRRTGTCDNDHPLYFLVVDGSGGWTLSRRWGRRRRADNRCNGDMSSGRNIRGGHRARFLARFGGDEGKVMYTK